jgi:hypothetical protein
MALDWRNRVDVAIIIATVAVAAIISDTVITGGAIVAVGSVIGVPAVVFVRRAGAQETPYRWVLLGQLVVILLFWGGVVPFPGHVIVVMFIFQVPIEEELEVLAVGQGLIVLWPGTEVPVLGVPV